jgi:uncharacterized membrane protein HdeD (DUF308 family)
MSDVDLSHQDVSRLARLWWVAVGLGVLSIVAGGIIIAKPDNSLKTLAVIAGIFILIDGIGELVMAFSRDTAGRGLVALLGTLNLIVGILLIRHPIAGVQAVALFIGIWLIAAGVVRLVMALDSPGNRLSRIIVAVIEGIFGIAIVSSSHIGFATLAVLVGLSFIANGIGVIAFGILLRTLKNQGEPPGVAVPS